MRTFVHMHGREGSDGLVDTIEGLGADVQELQLDGAMMLENKHFTNTRQAGCAPSIVLRQEVAVAKGQRAPQSRLGARRRWVHGGAQAHHRATAAVKVFLKKDPGGNPSDGWDNERVF